MGRVKKSLGIVFGLLLVVGVVYLTTQVAGNYLGSSREKTGVECPHVGQEHFVEAKDNKMQPEVTNAKLCDQLTITNKDDKLRRIAFGVHDQHIAYNGTVEKILRESQSFSVVLNEPGEFVFHDHLQEETAGEFIVN
ncbi:MAG TPA: hypothetical protein VFX86_01165 [Candidatus Saccharimonadales bacterium]|nr:hypothetical protein [Candidatus Saccharimonadales bacterium]